MESLTHITWDPTLADAAGRLDLPARFLELYDVQRLLGAGAVGTVYLARHRALDRAVAVKFLRGRGDASVLHRFQLEARSLARIDHPGVIRVFDSGEIDGHPYLVTEVLEGGTLQKRMRGPMPHAVAVPILLECLAGLEACHQAGVIHRDFKPANVLFTSSGRAKIADLGIARLEGSARATIPGSLVGTPLYMAPEQILGEDVDARSDVYAAAFVLYEMIAGESVYPVKGISELLYAKTHKDPAPLAERVSGMPGPLADAIHRALSKDRNGRPASAARFAAELEAAVAPAPAAVAPAARPTSGKIVLPKPEPDTPPPARASSSQRTAAPQRRTTRSVPAAVARPAPKSRSWIGGVVVALGAAAAFALVVSKRDASNSVEVPPVRPSPSVVARPSPSPVQRPEVPKPSASAAVAAVASPPPSVRAAPPVKPAKASPAPPAEHALLYANAFDDDLPAGAPYPRRGRGKGPLVEDVDIEAVFHPRFAARFVRHADGTGGLRFPTHTETPGGYNYSTLYAYANLRDRLLKSRLRVNWTIRLPEEYAFTAEHAYLACYFKEGRQQSFSLRFVSDTRLAIFLDGAVTEHYIDLPRRLEGRQTIKLALDIDLSPGGLIRATANGIGHTRCQFGAQMEAGDRLQISAPGNSQVSETDPRFFATLDSIEVRALGR
jgi:serine/threonine protein kinase